MSDLDTALHLEAREAAEKRYPTFGHYKDCYCDDCVDAKAERSPFVAGYVAGSTRPVTESEIQFIVQCFNLEEEDVRATLKAYRNVAPTRGVERAKEASND